MYKYGHRKALSPEFVKAVTHLIGEGSESLATALVEVTNTVDALGDIPVEVVETLGEALVTLIDTAEQALPFSARTSIESKSILVQCLFKNTCYARFISFLARFGLDTISRCTDERDSIFRRN